MIPKNHAFKKRCPKCEDLFDQMNKEKNCPQCELDESNGFYGSLVLDKEQVHALLGHLATISMAVVAAVPMSEQQVPFLEMIEKHAKEALEILR